MNKVYKVKLNMILSSLEGGKNLKGQIIDDIDTKIINLLQTDGRMSNLEIAKKIGVSEGTVRNRIAKLTDQEIIQIVAVANPFKIGLSIAAIIKIEVDIKKVDYVAEQLQKVDEIWYIALATGNAEFDVEVYVASMDDLNLLLKESIWPIDGILHTTTTVILSYLKRSYDWKFPLEKV